MLHFFADAGFDVTGIDHGKEGYVGKSLGDPGCGEAEHQRVKGGVEGVDAQHPEHAEAQGKHDVGDTAQGGVAKGVEGGTGGVVQVFNNSLLYAGNDVARFSLPMLTGNNINLPRVCSPFNWLSISIL